MIEENMLFYDFDEFYVKRNVIRLQYNKMSNENKRIYRYYVYSRRLLKEKICDMIWIYLNAVDAEEFAIAVDKLHKEHARYL